MENRRVWLFYAVVVTLWVVGFFSSAVRTGQASRQHDPTVISSAAPTSSPLATRN